jgi:hypothetical protein
VGEWSGDIGGEGMRRDRKKKGLFPPVKSQWNKLLFSAPQVYDLSGLQEISIRIRSQYNLPIRQLNNRVVRLELQDSLRSGWDRECLILCYRKAVYLRQSNLDDASMSYSYNVFTAVLFDKIIKALPRTVRYHVQGLALKIDPFNI